MATIGQSLAQPENGWNRYDDTHKFLKYTGNWTAGTVPSGASTTDYNQTQHYTNTIDSAVKFAFIGSSVRIIAQRNTNRSDKVKITIDDAEYFYSEKGEMQSTTLVFEKINLPNKEHRVIIEKTSNDASYISIDAIDINKDGELLPPPVFIGDALTSPEAGWRRYDNTYSGFKYAGSGWAHRSTATTNPQYNNTDSYTSSTSDYMTFNFSGTKIRIISFLGNGYSSDNSIIIDGVDYKYSAYSINPYVSQILLWEKIGLEDKLHIVKIKMNSGSMIAIDAIDIDDNAEIRESYHRMTVKNPTTNEHYSLVDNTLIHLPDNSPKNMILHGIEQGKEIQLDTPFTKHIYINESSTPNGNGKVFTQNIGKIDTINIKEVK